jgi:hypothetical protein
MGAVKFIINHKTIAAKTLHKNLLPFTCSFYIYSSFPDLVFGFPLTIAETIAWENLHRM